MSRAAAICLACNREVRDGMAHPQNTAANVAEMLGMLSGAIVLIGWLAASVIGLYGVGLFGYQLFVWLRAGVWVPLPALFLFVRPSVETTPHLSDFVRFMPSLRVDGSEAWFFNPQSWLGLHKLLVRLLGELSVPALAIVLALLLWLLSLVVFVGCHRASERLKD